MPRFPRCLRRLTSTLCVAKHASVGLHVHAQDACTAECLTLKKYNAGGFGEMPSKEADAHMLSTLMQVQDFLRSHRHVFPLLPPHDLQSLKQPSHPICLGVTLRSYISSLIVLLTIGIYPQLGIVEAIQPHSCSCALLVLQ